MLKLSRDLPCSRPTWPDENLDGLVRPYDRTGYCNGRDGRRRRQRCGTSSFTRANALAVTIYKRPHVGYESSGVIGLMNSRH
jgi:hypothetical protein